MDRRAFLTAKRPASPRTEIVEDPPQLRRTDSGLNPYSGSWGTAQISHLLKRTMFGAKKIDIDYFKTRTVSQAVDELQSIMLKNFQPIQLCASGTCSNGPVTAGDQLITNSPNPFNTRTVTTFTTAGGHTLVQVIDTLGRVIRTFADAEYAPGVYKLAYESPGLASGVYYARFQNGSTQQVRSMLKVTH